MRSIPTTCSKSGIVENLAQRTSQKTQKTGETESNARIRRSAEDEDRQDWGSLHVSKRHPRDTSSPYWQVWPSAPQESRYPIEKKEKSGCSR